jgi:hypothetical protein
MSPEHPALAGVHDVPWATVGHAYGPATDVPVLLEALTGSREQQQHALWELQGTIWHQGTVYEATAYAVPFLARLVLTEPAPLRDELLDLLAYIATGSSYLDVHQDLIRGGLTEDEKAAMQEELAHVRAARDAVHAWLPELLSKVMEEPTPGGLGLVARLAAAYPDDTELFTESLQWMWENCQDLRVRAALAIALARRGDPAAYADHVLSDLFQDLHANPQAGEAG